MAAMIMGEGNARTVAIEPDAVVAVAGLLCTYHTQRLRLEVELAVQDLHTAVGRAAEVCLETEAGNVAGYALVSWLDHWQPDPVRHILETMTTARRVVNAAVTAGLLPDDDTDPDPESEIPRVTEALRGLDTRHWPNAARTTVWAATDRGRECSYTALDHRALATLLAAEIRRGAKPKP